MESENPKPFRLINVIGPILFLIAIGAVSTRAYVKHSVPGEIIDARFDSSQGFRDFHNAIYFPVRAMLTGVNPYSEEYKDFHPDGLGFPSFAPSSLLLHSPLGFFTLPVAEVIYLVFNFALLILISWLALKRCDDWLPIGAVFMLAAVMVVCRPGLLNFFGLQMTLLLVLGCLLALDFSERQPLTSGFGLLLAFCKPQFGIPLLLLMLFRRNFLSVVYGILLAVVVNGAAVWIIAGQNGGVHEFVSQTENRIQFDLDDPIEAPHVRTSWTRIDLGSVIARWYEAPPEQQLDIIVPACVLLFGIVCLVLERNRSQLTGINSRSGLLVLLLMLIVVYHQPYDALVLWIPLTALLVGATQFQSGFSRPFRCLMIVLLVVPMFNYLGTMLFLNGGLSEYLPEVYSYLDQLGPKNEIPSGAGWQEKLQHSWKWKLIVTVNGMALVLAALLVGLRMIGSNFLSSDGNE